MQGALPTPHEQGKLDMHRSGSLACMPPNHPRACVQASRLPALPISLIHLYLPKPVCSLILRLHYRYCTNPLRQLWGDKGQLRNHWADYLLNAQPAVRGAECVG